MTSYPLGLNEGLDRLRSPDIIRVGAPYFDGAVHINVDPAIANRRELIVGIGYGVIRASLVERVGEGDEGHDEPLPLQVLIHSADATASLRTSDARPVFAEPVDCVVFRRNPDAATPFLQRVWSVDNIEVTPENRLLLHAFAEVLGKRGAARQHENNASRG